MSVGRGTGPAPRVQRLDAHPLTGSAASGIGAMPGMSLDAAESGLLLVDAEGHEQRRWSWADVDGWEVGELARDTDGLERQLLTVRTRPAPLALLADVDQLPAFLLVLAEAHAGARRLAERRRRRSRMRRLAAAAACVALVGGLVGTVWSQHAPARAPGRARTARRGPRTRPPGRSEVHLAKATAPPVAAPPPLAAAPLAAHEAFGFLPYWALTDPAQVDLSSLTTLAYFSVDVTAAGTVDESPSNAGWAGYQSQALARLVTEAHRNGMRAVLTATCFDQAALDALTHDPTAQTTLAATLVTLVRAKNLDGVNLDFEGTGPTDRAGLVQLVATVSEALHRADPSWQFTVDTYASSASGAGGFYDIVGMVPYVDAFVVMDYDMGDTFSPGPTGGSAYTDQRVVATYSTAAGPSKVILGMPLYGEEWPTTGPTAGDPATGPAIPVADEQVAPTDTVYWDPATGGPWAVSRVGRQWYQVWFNDPASLAAKARLAIAAGLRGEAVWALGMATGTGDQQAAFTGTSSQPHPPNGPMRVPGAGMPGSLAPTGVAPILGTGGARGTGRAPTSAAVGVGAGAGGASGAPPAATGEYDGQRVSLVPWAGGVPSATTPAGSLGAFAAPGTSVACLANGTSLPVVQLDGTSAYLVAARTPTDCARGTWAFVVPSTGGATTANGGTGTATAPTTTAPTTAPTAPTTAPTAPTTAPTTTAPTTAPTTTTPTTAPTTTTTAPTTTTDAAPPNG